MHITGLAATSEKLDVEILRSLAKQKSPASNFGGVLIISGNSSQGITLTTLIITYV